jgi:hypothetical protein
MAPVVSGWSLVVRVMLSLCLVLNGIGAGGMAHARPAFAAEDGRSKPTELRRVTSSAANESAAGGAATPCHGAHVTTTSSPSQTKSDSRSHAMNDDSLPSCCHLAGCGGTCLQHPAGAIPCGTAAMFLVHADEAVPLRAFHAAPELPHLTRPPIV